MPSRRSTASPSFAKGRSISSRPVAARSPGASCLTTGDDELLYGRHAVLEALRAGRRRVRRICLAAGVQHGGIVDEIGLIALERGISVSETSREVLDREINGNHQGVAASVSAYPYVDLDTVLAAEGDGLYLALDHLQDVQNLGTLLRTAEAMAVSGVILPGRRSAAITPAVVNASAGAVEHLSIALVGNLVQALEHLKEAGVWVAGLEGDAAAIPLASADLTGPLALVVGAEGAGLSRLVRQRCDWLVSIPMYGRIESLNAAVAGSIVLAVARQARINAAAHEAVKRDVRSNPEEGGTPVT